MAKCAFSGENIEKGTGLMFVDTDGRVYHFKDRKSYKNFSKLKRKPRTTKWSSLYIKGTVPTKKGQKVEKTTKSDKK